MFYETILVLLVIFLITAYWYLKHTYAGFNDQADKIPGKKPEWFFGNLKNSGVVTGKVTFHEVFTDWRNKYGDVFTFWLGSSRGLVLSNIEHVRYVLADRQTYDQSQMTMDTFGLLFPQGLIALRGNNWKRHARFLVPMFRPAKIVPYFETIVDCVDRLINEHLIQQNGKICIDLVAKSRRLLLNVISYIAFDYDMEDAVAKGSNLVEAFNDFVNISTQLVISTVLPRWLAKLVLMMNWRYRRATRIIKQYCMDVIARERSRQKEDASEANKSKNLIASLVAASDNDSASLTSDELFDEVSMSFLAGFETTSTALAWFIFYITKYPDVQEKIKKELKEHNLIPGAPLTQHTLESLTYVECVTKEVFRISPIGASFSRQAMRDDMIGNFPVRKGDNIIIAYYNLQRDPRYWNIDPMKFVPERFLDQDKSPPQCAYMPFAAGHRPCIGQDLAYLELKIAITRLMQRVTFEDPGEEANNSGGYEQRITCYPKYLAARIHIEAENTTT